MLVGVYPPLWRRDTPGCVSDNTQVEPGPRIPESSSVLRVAAPTLVMALRVDEDARYEIRTLDRWRDDELSATIRHCEGIFKVMGWQDRYQEWVILCDVQNFVRKFQRKEVA